MDWWLDGLVGNEVAMFCGNGSGAWFWIYGFVELKGDLPGLTRTWAKPGSGIWGMGNSKRQTTVALTLPSLAGL